MPDEELSYVRDAGGIAPELDRLVHRHVQAYAVAIDFAVGWRAGVAPSAIRIVVPGSLTAKRSFAFGYRKGISSCVDRFFGDTCFCSRGFEIRTRGRVDYNAIMRIGAN